MIYLKSFDFPSVQQEINYTWRGKKTNLTCYSTDAYPFKILSGRGLFRLDFVDITILYGGNGSGKSTALNIIAEKLGLSRLSPFNETPYTEDYVALCAFPEGTRIPSDSRIITSDDVFDRMLDLRGLNRDIDRRRFELYDEWLELKSSRVDGEKGIHFDSLADLDALRVRNDAKRKGCTSSAYINRSLDKNIASGSNGENAFGYFTHTVREDALYLLDEPENSLSPSLCAELARFIADSARFYRCQFIIATHSPLLLAMKGAKIYDLDGSPARVRKWTDLENVRVLRDFFAEHEEEFNEKS